LCLRAASLAQLVEHRSCKAKVVSSSLTGGSENAEPSRARPATGSSVCDRSCLSWTELSILLRRCSRGEQHLPVDTAPEDEHERTHAQHEAAEEQEEAEERVQPDVRRQHRSLRAGDEHDRTDHGGPGENGDDELLEQAGEEAAVGGVLEHPHVHREPALLEV